MLDYITPPNELIDWKHYGTYVLDMEASIKKFFVKILTPALVIKKYPTNFFDKIESNRNKNEKNLNGNDDHISYNNTSSNLLNVQNGLRKLVPITRH